MNVEFVLDARLGKFGGYAEESQAFGGVETGTVEPASRTRIISEGEDLTKSRDLKVVLFQENTENCGDKFEVIVITQVPG